MSDKIHPELQRQLEQAGRAPVQAILQLRAAGHPDVIPSPDDAAKLADTLLHRVAADIGHPATRHNLFRNLAHMVVEADPAFLRALIHQPEVISAIPNQTAESPFILPKGKRPE